MMADRGTNYRTVLADVADELTDDDAKALAFELVIPRGERGKIINGRTLIDVMEKNEMVSEDKVDQLLKLLRKDVAMLLQPNWKATNKLKTPGAVSSLDTCDSPSGQEQSSSDRYQMNQIPRGHCLILTYDEFTSESKLKKRAGNEKDKVKLNELFGEVLNFEVHDEYNLNYEGTNEVISKMAAKEDHKDCFICCVCSHGDGQAFFTTDGGKIEFQYLMDKFKPQNCEGLRGKPKIFFFVTCLGERFQEFHKDGIGSDGAGLMGKLSGLWAKEADFCICLSTVPGYANARDPSKGTIYVQNVYECFKANYKSTGLIDMLNDVRERTNEKLKQNPVQLKSYDSPICHISPTISTLLRKVYFSS
ncbi:Caspase-8 [Apostichopus japonicus]|uniref:Caspase-8 n=1 Tax=Stichopus japonicus TaxID=307972 RepID=A0A2G8LQ12_STIJA|nr:Caspase-8 [Apostichopus japonicus]